MNTKTKILAATVAAVAITGGIGATLATAETPSPTATPSATPTQKADKTKTDGKNKSLQQRALHGEVTLGGKKARVVDFQRGTVAKISATSVTVTSKDGFTATYTIASTTKVRQNKAAGTIADVKVDDKVRVVATKVGTTVTAKAIVEHAK